MTYFEAFWRIRNVWTAEYDLYCCHINPVPVDNVTSWDFIIHVDGADVVHSIDPAGTPTCHQECIDRAINIPL